jgi:hypothetical protein
LVALVSDLQCIPREPATFSNFFFSCCLCLPLDPPTLSWLPIVIVSDYRESKPSSFPLGIFCIIRRGRHSSQPPSIGCCRRYHPSVDTFTSLGILQPFAHVPLLNAELLTHLPYFNRCLAGLAVNVTTVPHLCVIGGLLCIPRTQHIGVCTKLHFPSGGCGQFPIRSHIDCRKYCTHLSRHIITTGSLRSRVSRGAKEERKNQHNTRNRTHGQKQGQYR